MLSREDLGTAHTEPPLDRVTLSPKQPDPAGTHKVPPGPDGRQRHVFAVWDMVLESRGVQGTLRICFPCPIVVMGGSNLPKGQELVGLFAYRLVSGHLAGADGGGADCRRGRLRNHSITMGTAHNELQWGKLLWTHLWIDHMYYFAKKWRILSKFSCFAMEGSHRRVKRMSRNSEDLSLLRGGPRVQLVVDNHTIDDSLWSHGRDATKRPQHGQGPISVQTYASHTIRWLLTDMQYLETLQWRF